LSALGEVGGVRQNAIFRPLKRVNDVLGKRKPGRKKKTIKGGPNNNPRCRSLIKKEKNTY